MRPDTIKIFFIASSKEAARFVRNVRNEFRHFPTSTGASYELTRRSRKCIGAVSLQSLTEAEFVILVSCKKEMKRLSRREAGDWTDFRRKAHWALGAHLVRHVDRTPEPVEYSELGQGVPIEQHHGLGAVAWLVNHRSGP